MDRYESEVRDEINRAVDTHGPQADLPLGTGHAMWQTRAEVAKRATDLATASGCLTWQHILMEEVFEAMAESDPALVREELVQVEAMARRMRMVIDAREDHTHDLDAAGCCRVTDCCYVTDLDSAGAEGYVEQPLTLEGRVEALESQMREHTHTAPGSPATHVDFHLTGAPDPADMVGVSDESAA